MEPATERAQVARGRATRPGATRAAQTLASRRGAQIGACEYQHASRLEASYPPRAYRHSL